jgi:predicted Co/Zn/Cd cation transporter (cation efflux family)
MVRPPVEFQQMKNIAMNRPSFHLPDLEQKKWMVMAIVAAVVLVALVVGWYAGTGGFAEWGIFQE